MFAKVDVDDAEVSVETNKYLSELACAKRGKLATGVKRRGKLSAGFKSGKLASGFVRGKLADIASKILTCFKTTNGTCIYD